MLFVESYEVAMAKFNWHDFLQWDGILAPKSFNQWEEMRPQAPYLRLSSFSVGKSERVFFFKDLPNLYVLKHCSLFLDGRGKGGEGNVTPLQYSCLENSMDRGAW